MEKAPRQEKTKQEQAPKHVLTREEVLEAIGQHVEGYAIERELSDADGVYLLEARIVKEDGSVEEYSYKRKGGVGQNQAAVTTIQAVYYDAEGMPCGGKTLADYNEATGKWESV